MQLIVTHQKVQASAGVSRKGRRDNSRGRGGAEHIVSIRVNTLVVLRPGSKILNVLPWHLIVTRKGTVKLGDNLQERSGALFMTVTDSKRNRDGLFMLFVSHILPEKLQFIFLQKCEWFGSSRAAL